MYSGKSAASADYFAQTFPEFANRIRGWPRMETLQKTATRKVPILAIPSAVDKHAPPDGCETEQGKCARLWDTTNSEHEHTRRNVIIIRVSIRDFRDARAVAGREHRERLTR